MQLLEFSANQVSAESRKTHFKTIQNLKLVQWSLDEEMQPVAVEKTSSDTKKHHTYTWLLAI